MKNKNYEYYKTTEISNLKEMITIKAQEMPDKTAFVYPCETGEMKKTYLDFLNDVNAFGAWMYSKKMKDKHVAIIGENSYEWLVTFLASVCGGNVAVAIDKALPEDEAASLAKIGEVDVAFVSNTYFEKTGKKGFQRNPLILRILTISF